MKDQTIRLLKIGAPHGVKGAVRLISYGEDDGLLLGYSPYFDSKKRIYTLLNVQTIGKGLVGTFKEITTRTQAESLTHVELFINRDQLPVTDDNEFYVNDLIGMKAFSLENEELGKVVSIENYGASDIITLILKDGSEVMMPLSDPFVQDINLETNEIRVVLPVEA